MRPVLDTQLLTISGPTRPRVLARGIIAGTTANRCYSHDGHDWNKPCSHKKSDFRIILRFSFRLSKPRFIPPSFFGYFSRHLQEQGAMFGSPSSAPNYTPIPIGTNMKIGKFA